MNLSKSVAPRRMLVAYGMESTFAATTRDYLEALKRYGTLDIDYVHVTHGAQLDFDINQYDIVFNSYCAALRLEGFVSASYEAALQQFLGLKMIAAQDEYDLTSTLHRAIRRLGFHVYFTCVPKVLWPIVHPESELPGVHLVQVLTGYVPERLDSRQKFSKPLAERTCKIAYRGRDIGARYGRLGFDKVEIGRRMAEVCTGKAIPNDIATDEASRIYGDKWFEFLGDSRTMLGSESGSNAFDFDGTLHELVAAREKALRRRVSYEEIAAAIAPFEAPFDAGQISARVLECAAMRTPMIMYRGNYSGAVEPDVHYIALERNFSNIDAILTRIDDLDWLQSFADRAYLKLVVSGNYSYKSFVRLVEATAREQYAQRINPAFVAHRRTLSTPWKSWALSDRSSSLEHMKRIALRERPSNTPLGTAEFQQRQNELRKLNVQHQNELSKLSLQRQNELRKLSLRAGGTALFTASCRFVVSLALSAGRIVYHMLPRGIQHTLGGRLRRLRDALGAQINYG